MSRVQHLCCRQAGRLLFVAASLLSLLMLVSLAYHRNHDFLAHFACRDVRRSVERHTFIEQSKGNAAEHKTPRQQLLRFVDLETERSLQPLAGIESLPPVRIPILFSRLKISPTRSSPEAPPL